ncbi:MAG TPA: hypothetical protein VIO11_03440 [Candidatus Methanoperedens sp.]
MNSGSMTTNEKLEIIENGLKYLVELDLLDTFYDEFWIKDTGKLLDRLIDRHTFRDMSPEETDEAKENVIEWFGEDYGLAKMNREFWMVAVGSVDEGGYKWWFKIRLNTDEPEIARKVVLMDKCLPGRYCELYAVHR